MTNRTSPPSNALRIGTRGSKLARWQADWVAARLRDRGHTVEIVEISTSGDAEQIVPVSSIGSPGVFTKEIQRALLGGAIDVAVHSLKDLPTEPVEGLLLTAVPPRESASDVLVVGGSRERGAGGRGQGAGSGSLPADSCFLLERGARVGTGSLRRQAQLRHVRPDLRVEDVRGNVDTRLRKLDEGQFDALVLAEAGLRRLGVANRILAVLPHSLMLPAVGQGALAVECRVNDAQANAAVAALEDAATRAGVQAERALLHHLRGGCLAPVGAWGRVEAGELFLSAVVLSVDGAQRIAADERAAPTEAESLGRRVAESLLARGAGTLIEASRKA